VLLIAIDEGGVAVAFVMNVENFIPFGFIVDVFGGSDGDCVDATINGAPAPIVGVPAPLN
jgi:hypothetical protein